MKKQFILGFLTGVILCGAATVFAMEFAIEPNIYPIQVNGQNVTIEGYNINDYSYFKLRDIAAAIGNFDVDFVENTIQLSKDGYVYTEDKDIEYSKEFNRLFSEQEYILEDNLALCLKRGSSDTAGMVNAINNSKEVLLVKAFDIANLYLYEYDTNYAITMEELNDLCQNRYEEIVLENERNNPDFWTDGTIDRLTRANCTWEAAKDILKQYFYQLYKYTGKVEITLAVG